MVSHVFTHHSPGSGPSRQNKRMALFARTRVSGAAVPEGLMWTSMPKKSRVVLLDPDTEYQYRVRTWLFRRFEVFCCVKADAVLDSLRKIQPSLLIISGDPTSGEGAAITAELKKLSAFAGLPVLWLTPGRVPAFSDRMATWFQIPKPTDYRPLIQKILEILEHPPAPPDKNGDHKLPS